MRGAQTTWSMMQFFNLPHFVFTWTKYYFSASILILILASSATDF